MEKSRVLTTDFGYGDANRYSTQGTAITMSMRPLIDDGWLKGKFYTAPLNTQVAIPAFNAGTERIVSERSKVQPRRENPCWHYKYRAVCYPWASVFEGTTPASNWYSRSHYRIAVPAWQDVECDMAALQATIPLQQVKARAWATMQPEFGSDFSLMNFILELKDLKEVMFLIGRKESTLVSLASHCRKIKRAMYQGKIHKFDPSVPLSNLLLTYNLAIMPMIRDCQDIFSLLQKSVGTLQSDFQKAGLTLQKTHYSEWFEHENSLAHPSHGDYFWLYNGKLKRTRFTATMAYTYDYKMRTEFAAWLKYWGFTGDMEVFWNALPMSFLLDYFIGIGDALAAAKRDDHVTRLYTHTYVESLKTESSYGAYFCNHSRLRNLIVNEVPLATYQREKVLMSGYEATMYHRYLTDPYKGLIVPKLKIPKTKQWLNLLSILRLVWR